MNTARVVAVVMRVRVHCRQFHRRHVTPASSRQTTSPGSGCSTHGCAVARGVERLVAGGAHQSRRAFVAGQILAADGQQVRDRDRVVGVGEAIDAGQAAVDPPQQCLDAGTGSLRLRAERAVGLAPLRYRLELFGRATVEPGGGAASASRSSAALASSLGPGSRPSATISTAR